MSNIPCIVRSWWSKGLILSALAAVAGPAHAQVANNPPLAPITLTVFTERDFVHATGYNPDDRVVVKVIHPDGTVRSTEIGRAHV